MQGGDDQLWGSGRGAIPGCHWRVLFLDAIAAQGAMVGCYGRVPCVVCKFNGKTSIYVGGFQRLAGKTLA